MHLVVPQDPHTSVVTPSSTPIPATTQAPTLDKSPPSITYCTAPQSLDDLDDDSAAKDNSCSSEVAADIEAGFDLHRCESGKLCTHTIIDPVPESQSKSAPCMPTIVVESHPDASSMADARIVILGARKVGKSAVTVRFLTKRYIGEYESNIDLLYRQTVVQNNVPIYMEVLDSCSQAGVSERANQVQWGNAFVVVYSVCDRQTFQNVYKQITYIQTTKSPSAVPIAIIGNKVDLEHRREVPTEDGKDLAEEYGCYFFEVSAADDYNQVREAFVTLLKDIYETRKSKMMNIKRRRSSVTRNMANKVMQAMFGSPRRSRKVSLP